VNSGGTTGRRIWPDAELRRYKGLFRSTGQTNPDQTVGCSANDAHIGVGAEKVTIALTCTGAYGHGFLQAIRLVNFIKLVGARRRFWLESWPNGSSLHEEPLIEMAENVNCRTKGGHVVQGFTKHHCDWRHAKNFPLFEKCYGPHGVQVMNQ
jgi:hypothetical protein